VFLIDSLSFDFGAIDFDLHVIVSHCFRFSIVVSGI
jgi:hypothetical protein